MKTDKTIKVGVLYNAFDPSKIEYSDLVYRKNVKLKTVLRDLPTDCEWKIGLNGKPIEIEKDGDTRLKPNDSIQLVVVPRGGGSKNILRMVAMVAVVVGAAVLFGPGGLAFSGTLFGLSAAATGALLMSTFVLAGGLLINALLPPKTPKTDSEDSSSYSYSGAKNTATQGVALPVVYGRFRVAGNYSDLFTENVGDDQYLYGRTVLSDGEIENVTLPLLNDQDIETYDDVDWGFRVGTQDETINPYFNRNISQISKAMKMDGGGSTWLTHTTTNEVDKFQVTFQFPKGLVHITSKKGKKKNHSVKLQIQYRLEGATSWINWPATTTDPASVIDNRIDLGLISVASGTVSSDGFLYYTDKRVKSMLKTTESPVLPVGVYEIRYRKVSAEGDQEYDIDETYISEIGEITTTATNMRNIANAYFKIKFNEQLSSVPTITWLVDGVKINKYDINGVVTEKAWSDNPAWIVLDMLLSEERGVPGIFNIDFPAFVEWAEWCESESLKYNGVFDTTTTLWDACVDVLKIGHATFTRIGTKLSVAIDRPTAPVMLFGPGNIKKDTFNITYIAMNDRANEFELSYFDREDNNVQKTLRIVDPEANRRGDIPRSVSYSMPGIDNFDQAQREAWYQLYNNRYLRRTVSFEAPIESIGLGIGDVALIQHDLVNWGQAGRLDGTSTTSSVTFDRPVTMEDDNSYSVLVIHNFINRATGTIAGITSNVLAITTSTPQDLTLDNVKRLVQGSTDRQIIAINASGTNVYVTVDDATGFSTGSTVTFVDTDVIEERDVVYVAGEDITTVTTVLPFSAAPLKYSNFMFGNKEIVKKPYRLKSMSGTGYDSRTLSFVEYNEAIYNPPEMIVPLPSTTQPKTVNHVTGLAFLADPFAAYDATILNGILSWSSTNVKSYGGADVYIAVNGADYTFYKSVFTANECQVMLQYDADIVFKVVAFNTNLVRATSSTAPTLSFTTDTELSSVDAPTSLDVQQISYITSGLVEATWLAPADLTANETTRIRYRVQVKPDGNENWDEYGVTDQLYIRINELPVGTHIVRVRSEIGAAYSDWAEDAVTTFMTDQTITKDGVTAITGYLTNENCTLWAYASGDVADYGAATGQFVIMAGTEDVSSLFVLSTLSNPQGLTIGYSSNTYTVSGGFANEVNNAAVIIRAAGTGKYEGLAISKTFSLSKTTGGYQIVTTLPTTNNFEGRVVYLETDGKLYRYHGGEWTSEVSSDDLTGTIITDLLEAEFVSSVNQSREDIASLTSDVTDLQETYGDTASAAASAAAANTSANEALASKNAAQAASDAAASSEAAASASSNAASNYATAANDAKDASQAAQALADASKTAAANSATAAQTAKTGAETAATNAANAQALAQDAAADAQTSETNAASSAGAASTSAGQASTSATNAAGSASSAANYSTTAANSATAATNAAIALLPSDFTQNGTYWSSNYLGLPSRTALVADTNYTFPTVTGIGVVLQMNAASANRDVAPLGWIAWVAARRYRVTARMRVLSGTGTVQLHVAGLTETGTLVGSSVYGASTVTTTWANYTYTMTADIASGSAFIRPIIRGLSGATNIQISSFIIEDVTSEVAAASSASAASTSASTASTQATNAGTSATAAQTSATNAATSAGNAQTYANNASSSADTATTKASEASTSAGAAATSATNAGNSATAASTSASTASTKASEAATSASTATTQATNASTSAGQASTYATNASNSATSASGSATTATTQAGVASTAATTAIAAAGNANPTTFENDATFFYGDTRATSPSRLSFRTVTDGRVAYNNTDSQNGVISWKATVPYVQGNTYRVTARVRLASGATTGSVAARASVYNSSGRLGFSGTTVNLTTVGTWVVATVDVAPSYSAGTYVVPEIVLNATGVAATVHEILSISLLDVTSETKATTQATAAANSASAASTSATNAGTSATAAQTSATNASTSAGNAQTYANNASTSATNASNSANSASTSAGAAATSATNAGNSATAASTSASTASTKATEASNSASAAASSATTASTQAGNASTSATQAATSATAAGTSATNASTSATTAAASANQAALAAASLLPDKIMSATDNTSFTVESGTGGVSNSPPIDTSRIISLADGFAYQYPTLAANSTVYDFCTRAYVPATIGRIYCVEADVYISNLASGDAPRFGVSVRKFNSAYGDNVGYQAATYTQTDTSVRNIVLYFSDTAKTAANGNPAVVAWGNDNAGNAPAFLRFYVRLDHATTTTIAGSIGVIKRLKVTDATDAFNTAANATAAATSATNASTSATAAGTSATAAATSATNASTSAGAASTSATQAATSANTATTQANNASTSATTAATNAGYAANYATQNMLSKGVWTDNTVGQWTNSTVVDDTDMVSPARTKVLLQGNGNDVRDGGYRVGNWASRTIRCRGWVKNPNGTAGIGVGIIGTNAAGSSINSYTPLSAINGVVSGWTAFDVTVTTLSTFVTAAPFVRSNSPYGTMWTDLIWTDITESTAAASSASAASTSATSAATSATNASTSASAAATSATTASTQAGNASTSATNAATSATNAATSANTASTSATTAATSANTAINAATATMPDRLLSTSDIYTYTTSTTAAPSAAASIAPANIFAVSDGYACLFSAALAADSGIRDVCTRGVVPATVGRIYKIEAEAYIVNLASGDSPRFDLNIRKFDANYGNNTGTGFAAFTQTDNSVRTLTAYISDTARAAANGNPAVLAWGTDAAGNAPAFFRLYVRMSHTTTTIAGTTGAVRRLTVTDVTDAFNAAVSASAAATSATTATTQATNAANSATAASTSATNASSAYTAAAAAAQNTNPTTFENDGLFFGGDTRATSPARISFRTVTEGRVAYNNTAGSNAIISWKGSLPYVYGNTYRITAKIRLTAGTTATASVRASSYNASGRLGFSGTAAVTTTVGTWVTATADVTPSFTDGTYIVPEIVLNATGTTDGVQEIISIQLQDVTSEKAASTSANAAATSATTASTQAGNASTSATAASNSALAASTSATNASTSATNASTSAANASTSAASASTSATLAANIANASINANPTFNDYPSATVGAAPTNWNLGNSGVSSSYRTDGETAGYAYRMVSAASTNCYAGQLTAAGTVVTGGYYVIEADIKLNSGALTGAGVLFRTYNAAADTNLGDQVLVFSSDVSNNTGAAIGVGTVGQIYRFRKLVQVTYASASRMHIHAMAHWDNIGSITAANDITFYRCAVRAATDQEIAVGKPTTGLSATVTTQAGAISTLQGKTAAYWNVTANAGTSTAVIAAKTDGTSSIVTLAASKISLATTDGSTYYDALVIENGNAYLAGKLRAGSVTSGNMLVTYKGLNPDPLFEGGSSLWGGFASRVAEASAPTGCPAEYAAKFSNRDNMCVGYLSVVPGEQYKISGWVNANGGSGGGGVGLVYYGQDAAGGSVVQDYVPGATTTASGWVFVSGTVTMPAGVYRLKYGPWADRTTYVGELWCTDLQVEKLADASLIVDGTIVASKIASATITATQLAANSVTVDQLSAGAVTAAKMSVTSLASITATIGTLRTATSGARTEISDNVIKVYDSSNVLRVQIGDQAL